MQVPLFPFLLETALKSTAVLAAAWLIVIVLRGKSAAVRHLVWCIAFAGVLAMPVLTSVFPGLAMPSLSSPEFAFFTTAYLDRMPQQTGAILLSPPTSVIGRLPDWHILLMLIWGAGVAVSFTQMLIGGLSIQRLRRRSHVFHCPSSLELASLMQVDRKVELRETEAGTMPMTYGVFKPTIFLPTEAHAWTEARRRMVVLHELAHVRRGDGATHLMARIALSFYWWNPLAWPAWREFLKERERAADDLVLNAGADRPEYASHLLEIARSLQSAPDCGWPAMTMASRSQLEGRLCAILDPSRDRQTPPRATVLIAAFAALAVIGPIAALKAQTTVPAFAKQTETAISALGFVQAGDQARQQGKLDQAKALYTKALTTEPGEPIALIHRGTVELETKDFPAALDDFEQAQKTDSRYASEALMWQAITQERDNKPDAAEQLYQHALGAADMHSISAATTMDLYGQLLQQQGKYDQANLMHQQAAAIRDAQPQPHSTYTAHRIGKDVHSPVLKSKVEPEYSPEARAAKYDGTVLLNTEIGADGRVRDIQVIRPLGLGLDEKAVEAVTKWRFEPGTISGQPVAVRATIEVKFKLN